MTLLKIDGMKCQHCAAATKKTLEELGASAVEVDLAKGEVTFGGELELAAVRQALAAKGFTVVE